MAGPIPVTDIQESAGPTSSQRHRSSIFGSFSTSKTCKSDSEMRDLASQIVEGLTEEEKEHAARSSYAYLWKSVTSRTGDKKDITPSKELVEERDIMATAMAMRFLKSKKGNLAVATQKLRNAIKFRKEMDVDGLRLCFQSNELDLDDETRDRYAMYREKLGDRMTAGRVYVCGYDKEGRAIYTIYAARTRDFDPEWFLKESLYNFERALACTERESGGTKDSITVIGNYTGFQSKHSAPMSISHRFMDSLRQNYPGRVHRVYLLKTPSAFLFFWSVLKPFIGTDTRKKIIFLKDTDRQVEFANLVSIDQAAPWMLDGGQKAKNFDSNEYLQNIPFNEGFDP